MSTDHPDGLEEWHRLHPLSPAVRGGRALLVLFIVVVPRLLGGGNGNTPALIGDAAVVAVGVVAGVVSWLVTRWRVDGPDLLIETGLIRRSSQRYPLRQLQAIDVVRSGVARVLGLAELRLRMAGGSNKGRLACLTQARAEQLREQLLELSVADGATVPSGAPRSFPGPTLAAGAPAGTPMVQVATGQLIASLLLTFPGLVLVLYVLLIVGEAILHPAAAARTLGGGLLIMFVLGTALARRFNGDYRLTVRQSAAGLLVSSGLVQTTTETLPVERVQALRMVEPLLWRPFGWCRVEGAVAGKSTRSEDRSQANRRRALLPVGSYAQAHTVIALVLAGPPASQTRPPARARWKSPLSYHRLSVGIGPGYAITTSGRLRRVSHWVPLEKVQSIRRTQGPVQRRLKLATVHLDTAGPRMRTALRDRDAGEADEHIEHLPGRCAAARRS